MYTSLNSSFSQLNKIESEQLEKIAMKNLSFTFARNCLHQVPGFIIVIVIVLHILSH